MRNTTGRLIDASNFGDEFQIIRPAENGQCLLESTMYHGPEVILCLFMVILLGLDEVRRLMGLEEVRRRIGFRNISLTPPQVRGT